MYVHNTNNNRSSDFFFFSSVTSNFAFSLLWPKCVFYQHHMHKNVTDRSCVVVDPKVVSSYVTLQEQSKTKSRLNVSS